MSANAALTGRSLNHFMIAFGLYLYFVRKKPLLCGFIIALGAAMDVYPFFLSVPILYFYVKSKNWKHVRSFTFGFISTLFCIYKFQVHYFGGNDFVVKCYGHFFTSSFEPNIGMHW